LDSDVVDILSDLQTKNYVSANQVGDVLRRTGEFWSNFENAPDRLISKQSAITAVDQHGNLVQSNSRKNQSKC
jgi:hypothetical protein